MRYHPLFALTVTFSLIAPFSLKATRSSQALRCFTAHARRALTQSSLLPRGRRTTALPSIAPSLSNPFGQTPHRSLAPLAHPSLSALRSFTTKKPKGSTFDVYAFANPLWDMPFKNLFANPKNEHLTCHFLNSILDLSGLNQIFSVKVERASLRQINLHDKTLALELICTDKSGKSYRVALEKNQNYVGEDRGHRIQYDTAAVHSRQLKLGERYHDLKPTICIIITDSLPFPETPDPITHHEIVERSTGTSFLQDMRWIFVEIPKFNKKEEELSSPLEEWLYLFREGYKATHLPEKCEPEVRQAYETLNQAKWSDADCMAYVQSVREQSDRNTILSTVEERGREEGREEGRNTTLKEVVKVLRDDGMDEDQIIKITGLTLEELETLQNPTEAT